MNSATALPPRLLSRWLVSLGAALYLALALAVAAKVVVSGLAGLHGPPPLALLCLVVAFLIERTSRRRQDPLWQNAAPAVYLAAVLLLPAPWAILVSMLAVLVCQFTTRDVLLSTRLTTIAHTTLVVTLCTVIGHARAGAGDHALLSYLAYLAGGPAGAWQAVGGVMLSLPAELLHAANLALLLLCYYLMDTLPLVLVSLLIPAVAPRHGPAPRPVGSAMYQIGALSCGALAAITAETAPTLALLALPALWGLHLAVERAQARRADERITRTLTTATAALRGEIEREGERAAESQARLETVLSSIRALGRTEDLAEVARTIVYVATRLTRFRTCTVYLYEWGDGSFQPRGVDGQPPLDGMAVPRARVEAMMAEQHMLGYSYYVRRGYRADPASYLWQPGDLLLVPLLLRRGEVIGYLSLDDPGGAYTPQAEDILPLETIAALAASVIARLRHTEEALYLAATDGLTGLLNRRSFEERLRRDLAEAARMTQPLTLLMVDIDDFGAVNNAHGHPTGDAALRLVSGVVRQHLRESDAGCRYGGDEFAVILPGLDAERALEIAERLRLALVEATTRAAAEGTLPLLHTSIGVAAFPDDAAGLEQLIKAADDALYQSKRLGKNRVSLWRVA